jgi:hypothetical protein
MTLLAALKGKNGFVLAADFYLIVTLSHVSIYKPQIPSGRFRR